MTLRRNTRRLIYCDYMRNKTRLQSGFSLIEIITVIFIIGILLSVCVTWFDNAKKSKTLQVNTDTVLSVLEKAKINAISGNGGSSFGVKFNPGSYVYFKGNSYVANNPDNINHNLDSNYTLTETISNADNAIIFSRLTGATNMTATVTISRINDSNTKKNIVVEPLGNISVVQ